MAKMYLSSIVENGVTNCSHDNVQTIISALQLYFKFNSFTGAIKQIPFSSPHLPSPHTRRKNKCRQKHSLAILWQKMIGKLKILHLTATVDLYKSLNGNFPNFYFHFIAWFLHKIWNRLQAKHCLILVSRYSN